MSEEKTILINQKTVISFECEDRTYCLHVPDGAPLGELYDVCNQLTGKVLTLINQKAAADIEAAKVKDEETDAKSE